MNCKKILIIILIIILIVIFYWLWNNWDNIKFRGGSYGKDDIINTDNLTEIYDNNLLTIYKKEGAKKEIIDNYMELKKETKNITNNFIEDIDWNKLPDDHSFYISKYNLDIKLKSFYNLAEYYYNNYIAIRNNYILSVDLKKLIKKIDML